MVDSSLPTLRWGIVGCGLISSWFVQDLTRSRSGATTKHIVQAVGSSSKEKGSAFIEKHAPSSKPSIYSSYAEVYEDPSVEIVYIGTPHSCHLQNALDAINAGKNVLCEKPMTINAKETEILVKAAKEKGVFLMEAVWTRFFPIISSLQKLIHVDGAIGNISRVFVDFGLDMPISSLSPSSRTADPSLGAGALLDIGIYTLTWASIILDQHPDNSGTSIPSVASSMSFTSGADEMTSIILNYDKLKAQAICTASMRHKSAPEFCRIEGDKGTVSVGGVAASKPGFLAVRINGKEEEKIEFEAPGFGFYFEADAVAADLRNGRKENDIMPLQESLRLMKLMDRIRTQNGLRYKQDD